MMYVPDTRIETIKKLGTVLGISADTLHSINRNLSRHYHKVRLPKGNGDYRVLTVPDPVLKAVQNRIRKRLLDRPVSVYAAAYRKGGSVRLNALPHVGKEKILKIDIRHFFDRITYHQVKSRVFPECYYAEPVGHLLTSLCMYNDYLPQGAPTSPAISNIIMKQFDFKLDTWCEKNGISYTRYCDDLTFSGDFEKRGIFMLVKQMLGQEGFFINNKKTVFAGPGNKKTVTGVLVNDRMRLPSQKRRKLRQELYYCMKYGVGSHLRILGKNDTKEHYLQSLLGRVSFGLYLDKGDKELQEYKKWIIAEIKGVAE